MAESICQADISSKLWKSEPSTIIGRDKNLTAKTHQLAYPNYTRMDEDTGLVLHVSDDLAEHFQKVQIGRLGGEGRMCHITALEASPIFSNTQLMITRIQDTGRFKIVLLTPGFFENKGYYPDFLSQNNSHFPEGEWEIDGHKKKVQLVSMAVQRAKKIGGWNLATGVPKPMIKAVPAGTVYYFEMVNFDPDTDKDWITSLIQSSFPGTLPGDLNYCKQGFNTFFTGGWDYV
ncbi:MAG: hypothetical protein OMM_03044 [Candidatus Magnetoglobus multicellularis str. Araruama]|uniref:Uncharacterized protein n=1 Tax=Candidatus Magnetoglobus multicellularis str. Araruama TaxID=890399 RepID=A0A1V1P7D8_9BACT|nr:MAG: hypothetical protein OMM_03044 [Candidatus Magnetoglobus multicellularis str. Araruama]